MYKNLTRITLVLVLVTLVGIAFVPSNSSSAATVFSNFPELSSGDCNTTANRITLPVGDDYDLNSITLRATGTVTLTADGAGVPGSTIATLGTATGLTTLTPATSITLMNGASYWIRVENGTNCTWMKAGAAPTGIFTLTGTYWVYGAGPANGYTMSIDATVWSPPTTPSTPPSVSIPTDGRLNPEMADDTEVVLYAGRDADSNRTMQAYCVNSIASGYLGLVISEVDLPVITPTENTLVLASDICEIEFWVLAEGSQYKYQLNVGPNADGTVTELLFNDLNGADLTMRTFNVVDLFE